MKSDIPKPDQSRRTMDTFDILTLAEAYGEQVIESLSVWYANGSFIRNRARRAFHHAITFSELDSSYWRRWSEAERTAVDEERSR